jgi:hypothetical protein
MLVGEHAASAAVPRQAVDGLVQVHWDMGVDAGSMNGWYATSSQLGRGTIAETYGVPLGSQFTLVRSDGMRMTGQSSFPASGPLNLTGTADVQSASLTLTQLSRTPDPNHFYEGVAVYRLQGWVYPRRSVGYAMVDGSGHVSTFGGMSHPGDAPSGYVTGIARTPDPRGYWIVNASGQVYALGDARYRGGLGPNTLLRGETVTSIASTPTGNGYWLFTTSGRVFVFGDATSHGDLRGRDLAAPVGEAVATPTGNGYYMVARDGGIFAFGDAHFRGSMTGARLNGPIIALVPTRAGTGYWLVASDGGVFAFNAPFRGSWANTVVTHPVVAMATFGNGYLMVRSDGSAHSFAANPFFGGIGVASSPPVVGAIAIG